MKLFLDYQLYNIQMEEQLEFTQEELPFQPQEKTEVEDQSPATYNPLFAQYQQTLSSSSQQIIETVRSMMKYRQKRTYHMLVSDKTDYFSSMWEFLQQKMNQQSEHLQTDLLEAVSIRQTNIFYDILQERLEISDPPKPKPYLEEESKSKKVNMLKQQQSQIQKKLMDINEQINQIKNQHSESRFKVFEINENKVKEYQQFMRKQKKQKQERVKLIQQNRKKQEEIARKKEAEEKEVREKEMQEKREEMLKQIKEKEEIRKRQRSQRQERNKQYKIISKSMAEQPPLFKKLQQNYYSRYAQQQNEKRQKILSERHSLLQTDVKAIEQHEKKYEQIRNDRQKQRRQRMQQHEKMMQLQQEEIHSKYKSHSDFKTKIIDPRIEEKRIAKEKKEKVKRYIEETVKERYLPRIDEEKRKQFLKMIEDLHKKKVRKVIREDGSVEYEELRPSDPRMVGLEYLQKTKQMAAKARGRRKSSDQIKEAHQQPSKVFDYLGQKRKKGTSMSTRDRYSFVSRKGMSFEDKIKKVQLQSQKLEELAKQKQMKLKYGKFTTSEEILQHKQQIDQHYMDIINMKLKLINVKEE